MGGAEEADTKTTEGPMESSGECEHQHEEEEDTARTTKEQEDELEASVDEHETMTPGVAAALAPAAKEDTTAKAEPDLEQKQIQAVAASILSEPLPPKKPPSITNEEVLGRININNFSKFPPEEARVLDAKIRFCGQINPLPTSPPVQTPASRPGAFPSHPPVDHDDDLEEEDDHGREIAVEDTMTVVSGLTIDGTIQNGLPIAAELAEDHERRLQEIEEKLRKEYEQRMEEEYIRRSQVEGDNIHTNTHHTNPVVTATTMDCSNHDAADSVQAIVLSTATPVEVIPKTNHSTGIARPKQFLGVLLLLLVLLAIILSVVIVSSPKNDSNPTNTTTIPHHSPPLQPVLQSIRQRGYVKCSVPQSEQDQGFGFSIDLCRAFAAALFHDSSRFEWTNFTWAEHFQAVHDGRLDVSIRQVSLNMQRDTHEPNAQSGFTYSTPYLYTGTGLAGRPVFVQCAKDAETFLGDCRDLQVCVTKGTVTQEFVEAHLPGTATVLVQNDIELMEQFVRGTCNVMSADAISLSEQRARDAGYRGDYVISDRLLSHEHLALLSRQDDPEWAQFLDWILRALITAEALNITQDTAEEMGIIEDWLFGPEYTRMFIEAIAAVGNYGEIYERNYGGMLPRSPYNHMNTGETGLIVSSPFGSLVIDQWSVDHQGILHMPTMGATMEYVYNRQQLFCGVVLEDSHGAPRTGFAEYNQSTMEWYGMDIDFCKGIATAVAAGRDIETVFLNLTDPITRYHRLANKTVDIIAGETFSLVTDVKEPTTGEGFTFSNPYFYYNPTTMMEGAALALLTREDDPQWSDLVNWILMATIYAEERGIVQETASEMPVVELFGQPHRQMFRDTINTIGNYGEIYERNMRQVIPRSGRNLLNMDYTPQLYPIIPFH